MVGKSWQLSCTKSWDNDGGGVDAFQAAGYDVPVYLQTCCVDAEDRCLEASSRSQSVCPSPIKFIIQTQVNKNEQADKSSE